MPLRKAGTSVAPFGSCVFSPGKVPGTEKVTVTESDCWDGDNWDVPKLRAQGASVGDSGLIQGFVPSAVPSGGTHMFTPAVV